MNLMSFEEFSKNKSSLIPLLQKIQENNGYLSADEMQ